MPSTPVVRYPEDMTGLNRDNRVADESHVLVNKAVRPCAPRYGPFFVESVLVFDKITHQPLVKDVQFKCVELLKEATLKTNKEICQLILIVDPAVSGEVLVTYQTIGGLYQNDSSAIVNLYETFLKDNRPIAWENVENKPYEYPPSLHNHLLHEVYGFEPVVVALERIRNAIILGNIPAFERLIEWVKEYCKNLGDRVTFLENKALDAVTEAEIIAGVPNNKAVTFERLLFALDKFNFNATRITPMQTLTKNKSLIRFDVETTAVEDYKRLYWTIEHIGTTDDDFVSLAGQFNIVAAKGNFTVGLSASKVSEDLEQFRIVVRRESVDGPVMGKTSLLSIKKFVADSVGVMDFITSCCFTSPVASMGAESYYMRDYRA